jgi:hypothetical protein
VPTRQTAAGSENPTGKSRACKQGFVLVGDTAMRAMSDVRCRAAAPSEGIDFQGRPLNTGPMGVRTRGLDIKAAPPS